MRSRHAITNAALALVLGAAAAVAAEPPESPAGTEPTPEETEQTPEETEPTPPRPRPDLAQRAASHLLFTPVRWVDDLFGEEIGAQETNHSYLRVSGSARGQERDDPDYRPGTRLKLDFPRVNRRLSLILSGGPDDDIDDLADHPDDGADLDVPAEEDRNNSFLGLNQQLVRWVRTRVDLRGGVKAGWRPFGQLRFRQDVPVSGRWLLRLTQTGQWIHEDGLGAGTRLELDRPIGRTLLRITGRATLDEFDGLDWSSGVSVYRPLRRRAAVSIDASVFGISDTRSEIVQYRVGTRFRVAVRPRWWFVEIEPELTWPLATDRYRVPAVTARTEIVLGWTG